MNTRQNKGLTASLPEKLQFLRRNPGLFTAWLLFALAVGVIGWGTLFANLQDARTALERRAMEEAAVLARTHADRLMRTLNALDQVARHVRSDWQRSHGRLQLEQLAKEAVFPPPAQYYVTLVDRDGVPLTSTLPYLNQVSLRDRSYFALQREATADVLQISEPKLSRISGANVVNVSRRLVDAEGAFSGIVLISVPVSSFTANYDVTTLGQYGLLGVVSDDRALGVARVGDEVLLPEAAASIASLANAFSSTSGTMRVDGMHGLLDQRSRFLGWHPVSGYPLTALVGLDESDTLAQYWAGRHSAVWYALCATIALGILTLIAMALSVELGWRNHRLSLSHATYRLATEEGSEGFYILQGLRDRNGATVDFTVLDCNQQGAEFLHVRRQDLIGKTVSSLSGYFDNEIFIERLRTAVKEGVYDREIEMPTGSTLDLKWVHLKIVRSGSHLAVRVRDISEPKAHVAELKRRGDEDVLTSLPNRQWVQGYLPDAIENARKAGNSMALLFIDLDGFKKVNDTAGHAAGDELLQHAAQRLLEAVRPHDKVARFGGDEFVVILEHIEHRTDATHVAERVQHAFEQPFRLKPGVYAVSTSIGIALFPDDGEDAAVLLEKADIAMYSVKSKGKHGYQFYEAEFYTTLRERLDKELEIRQAIERDDFVMYYQPRVDTATGMTVSLEALVRWQHPSKGLLEPCDFIDLAEETGLIVGIGQLVIDKVCSQLAQWSAHETELVPVSINVSPLQLSDSEFAHSVSTALARHHVPAGLVELEITESSVMSESGSISVMLRKLQNAGVKILVDDFGTGYSSLSQLQRLDFDVLKVDQSFTATIDQSDESRILFTAIVTMAHALGMRVVAEGVETLAQIRILQRLQCDEIQGFYISRPLPPEDQQPILAKSFFPLPASDA
jgi:diguanylate cyclase (GGDEF)-like protein